MQDITSRCVFISRDIVFEEGHPHRTSASVGEQPLFDADTDTVPTPLANVKPTSAITIPDQITVDPTANQINRQNFPVEPRRSARTSQPSQAGIQSMEYQRRETTGKDEGHDWANDRRRPQASVILDWSTTECEDFVACLLAETKASHHIP